MSRVDDILEVGRAIQRAVGWRIRDRAELAETEWLAAHHRASLVEGDADRAECVREVDAARERIERVCVDIRAREKAVRT